MLLMWDRGLHSYAMVNATMTQGCDYQRTGACQRQIRGGAGLSGWLLSEERLPQTASRRKKGRLGVRCESLSTLLTLSRSHRLTV